MRCHDCRKLIVLHLYGELEDEKRRRLEQHLDQCAACKKELGAFRTVRDRAAQKEFAVPSTRAVDEIRHAAQIAIGDAGQRSSWGGRLYFARAGVLALAASVLVVATVAILVISVGRGPAGRESEPPIMTAQPPVYLRTTDEEVPGAEILPRQPDILMPTASGPLGLETRLANLEADTFYIGRELALEIAPALDRRFQSLEDGVVTLALEWE